VYRGTYTAGAMNMPWSQSINDVCTFKSVKESEKLYHTKHITPDKEVIAYFRIGEWTSSLIQLVCPEIFACLS
jgi:thiosulfate/3-mercaptopyruvate sulfurtransferase